MPNTESATPRTDAVYAKVSEWPQHDQINEYCGLAYELEAKLTTANARVKDLEKALQECPTADQYEKQYAAELAAAREDGSRLDWLEDRGRKNSEKDVNGDWWVCFPKHNTSLRAAINQARKTEAP